jgi:hypothetical protein
MKLLRTNCCPAVILAFLAVIIGFGVAPASAQISVTSATPNAATQGTINLNVTVGGKGFKAGAKAQWFISGTTNPGGVTVNSTAFVNSNTLTANITVSSTAYVGGFDVVVKNTDGRSGKGTELFAVQSAPGQCTDVPLQLIVVSQTPGQGGISGDGLSIYNNPNDPAFNGGTLYKDGVGGVYAKFQLCNATNDFVLNLRSTSSPVRYLNLDFSVQLASPDTADGALDLTGQQFHQQGEQINEMANAALYTNGQFDDCSGFGLNALSRTVTGGNAWFHPSTLYDPVVPGCSGGSAQDLANSPINTSSVLVQQVNACTWTVSPVLDSTGTWHRIGVAETVKKNGTSTSVAGGQYQMPFNYEIQKLNCTP